MDVPGEGQILLYLCTLRWCVEIKGGFWGLCRTPSQCCVFPKRRVSMVGLPVAPTSVGDPTRWAPWLPPSPSFLRGQEGPNPGSFLLWDGGHGVSAVRKALPVLQLCAVVSSSTEPHIPSSPCAIKQQICWGAPSRLPPLSRHLPAPAQVQILDCPCSDVGRVSPLSPPGTPGAQSHWHPMMGISGFKN